LRRIAESQTPTFRPVNCDRTVMAAGIVWEKVPAALDVVGDRLDAGAQLAAHLGEQHLVGDPELRGEDAQLLGALDAERPGHYSAVSLLW
jgi:hypothetical protein